jgi:small subunit ribosomal protein S3
MGQKVNPKLFRLVENKDFLSKWVSNKINYSNLLSEDQFIRNTISNILLNILVLSKITIDRINNDSFFNKDYTLIKIYALYPREKNILYNINKYYINLFPKINFNSRIIANNIFFLMQFLIKNQLRNIVKLLELKYKKNYFIEIFFIDNLFNDSTLIAKHISTQIEKRIPFRKVIQDVISKYKTSENIGIKISISGRLNGTDIARTEWKKDGKIPLHNISSNINYSQEIAKTIYGIIGIKVWLVKNK